MRKFDFAAGGWKYVSGYKMLIGKMGVSRDRNIQNTLRMANLSKRKYQTFILIKLVEKNY